jgi:hypothetical protein
MGRRLRCGERVQPVESASGGKLRESRKGLSSKGFGGYGAWRAEKAQKGANGGKLSLFWLEKWLIWSDFEDCARLGLRLFWDGPPLFHVEHLPSWIAFQIVPRGTIATTATA